MGEECIGLKTQPGGVAFLIVRVEDMFSPTLICWGQSMRKYMSHAHWEGLRPTLYNLVTSLWGVTVLHAEQKSTRNIFAYVSGVSRSVRVTGTAVEIVSFIERLLL